MKNVFRKAGLLICMSALLVACGSSPNSRFYVLNSDTTFVDGQTIETQSATVIGVGPIVFPSYLDRPQMVTRVETNQVDIDEFNRWAEPLDKNFTNVLVQNISYLRPDDRFITFPTASRQQIDYRLTMRVDRFDVDASGKATLVVDWRISEVADRTIKAEGRSTYTQQAVSADPADKVAALNETLNELSREIALFVIPALD